MQLTLVNQILDFWALTKPRVVALIMITATAGAILAAFEHSFDLLAVTLTLMGIALVAAAGAAFNCLVETVADSMMKRTQLRPLPAGRLTHTQAASFVIVLGASGLLITTTFGGITTGILTGIAFFGYAVIYTLLLKRLTPQNIVIGGAAGAMPPMLGWAAVTGEVSAESMLLFLIIFVWTPPHFWALAIYRKKDYQATHIPMLPVTHGDKYTVIHILFYTTILSIVTLLPYLLGMAGELYLIATCALNARFTLLAWRLYKTLSLVVSHQLFTYSIVYLALLFGALMLDRLVWALL